MPRPPSQPVTAYRRRSHWLAWALAVGTFPLIWVGGLVTTYEAGMAVPDWPNTYGYNLFLYPPESWLRVWDLFLEHSHRLIGAGVGLVTIALAVALWVDDRRTWLRVLGVIALVAVIFQGTLGGLRVLGNEILLARIHGCTAPLFFALAAAMVAFTSRPWLDRTDPHPGPAAPWTWRLAVGATALIYVQIVLGAQLRHLVRDAAPWWFALWVWLHIILAGVLLGGVAGLVFAARRTPHGRAMLARRAWLLVGLFVVQILLGCLTWVTNYNWPAWFLNRVWPIEYTIRAEGRLQATLTTAHVAVGSLCLVIALSIVLWMKRLAGPAAEPAAGKGRPQKR